MATKFLAKKEFNPANFKNRLAVADAEYHEEKRLEKERLRLDTIKRERGLFDNEKGAARGKAEVGFLYKEPGKADDEQGEKPKERPFKRTRGAFAVAPKQGRIIKENANLDRARKSVEDPMMNLKELAADPNQQLLFDPSDYNEEMNVEEEFLASLSKSERRTLAKYLLEKEGGAKKKKKKKKKKRKKKRKRDD